MTREEFILKHRGEMLLVISEAWAARNENTQSLALLIDNHYRKLMKLLGDLYDELCPKNDGDPLKDPKATASKPATSTGTMPLPQQPKHSSQKK